MSRVAKNVTFSGRVQGVGFRYTVFRVANRYELTGYVRNQLDGTVGMIAQGEPDDIDDCVRDIEESFSGYIRDTKIEEIPLDPQHQDFKITF